MMQLTSFPELEWTEHPVIPRRFFYSLQEVRQLRRTTRSYRCKFITVFRNVFGALQVSHGPNCMNGGQIAYHLLGFCVILCIRGGP